MQMGKVEESFLIQRAQAGWESLAEGSVTCPFGGHDLNQMLQAGEMATLGVPIEAWPLPCPFPLVAFHACPQPLPW